MPASVRLYAGDRVCGDVTVFDAEPSFALVLAAFPESEKIVYRTQDARFEVHLGEASAIPWAD